MQTSLTFEINKSDKLSKLNDDMNYPVQFYSTIAVKDFLSNALQNSNVIKESLEEIIVNAGTIHYNINFQKSDKHLLYFQKKEIQFRITSTSKIKFWTIIKYNENSILSEYKENTKELHYKFIPEDFASDEDIILYFYVERAILDHESIDLEIVVYEEEKNITSFFNNNWTYIIIISLVIAIIFIIVCLKKQAKKAKEKKEMKEGHDEKINEIMRKRQEETRRFSLYIKKNLHKLDGRVFIWLII
jgi:hypothetical protein